MFQRGKKSKGIARRHTTSWPQPLRQGKGEERVKKVCEGHRTGRQAGKNNGKGASDNHLKRRIKKSWGKKCCATSVGLKEIQGRKAAHYCIRHQLLLII
jgi:hypothetical protein